MAVELAVEVPVGLKAGLGIWEEIEDNAGFGEWSGEGWDWLPADPFRAYLRHLSATTGTSWPVLAVLAGVSVPAARGLMVGRRTGRHSRPVRRICPELADRLLRIDVARVDRARSRRVPAVRAAMVLSELVPAAATADLAVRLGIEPAAFAELRSATPPRQCPELVAAAVEATHRLAWAGRTRPWPSTAAPLLAAA